MDNNGEIVIEKGVPAPMPWRYPFEKMEIGDSFVVPISRKVAAYQAVAAYRKKTGKRFVYAVEGGNFRIWRIQE